MRILHLNNYGASVGGVEDYIREVASALLDAGHSSHLVYFAPNKADNLISEATCIPVAAWPDKPGQAIHRIEEVIASFRPDVAYVHAVYHPDLMKWIGQRLPSVAYVHAPYPVCPGSAQYLRRSARVCPHTAGVICLFNAQTEHCCWGRDPLKHLRLLARVRGFISAYQSMDAILVGSTYMRRLLVRGGVVAEAISLLSPVLLRSPLPPAFHPEGSRTILFAGRLVPEKGLHLLIQALASVKGEWELVVAGDGEERERCEALCAELGLRDQVHFKGWLNQEEMAASYEACACAAMPSLWPEPFGRIGPEAFIRGRPVVAFATGGIPEWLEHGIHGYLAPAGDIDQLASGIQKLLDSPELRMEMGRRAWEKATTDWSAPAHISRLVRVLEDVVVRQ
jgi:glycosyltransferase involved in cell wall biosynthesis